MPRFVPVSNPEATREEQDHYSADNLKHRKFDNPHAVQNVKKVDRGWQQGSLGWGVLGAFGNDAKDDGAQVVRRTEGAKKMVKNERGLWVKAKDASDAVGGDASLPSYASSSSSSGRGRGGGVPVFGRTDVTLGSGESTSAPRAHGVVDPDDYGYKVKQRDASPQKYSRYDREKDRDREKGTDRDRDRSSDARDGRRREQHRSREDSRERGSRRHDSRDRSRERSRRRERDSRDRRDGNRYDDERDDRSRRRGGRSRDRHDRRSSRRRSSSASESRSRSRSRSYDRGDSRARKRGRDRGGDSRERRDSRRDSCRDRDRDRDRRCRDDDDDDDYGMSRDRIDSRKGSRRDENGAYDTRALEQETSATTDARDDVDDTGVEDTMEEEEEAFKFTAIQVVNRLQEVFASKSKMRLEFIMETFAADAIISSMKTGKVLVSGNAAIEDKFRQTNCMPAKCERRLYVELGGGRVSFALDLHAPHSVPGLGDPSKHTALLYRCEGSRLTHVWGVVDPDALAAREDPKLDKAALLASTVWEWAREIVRKEAPEFTEQSEMHFHDYTDIELWM